MVTLNMILEVITELNEQYKKNSDYFASQNDYETAHRWLDKKEALTDVLVLMNIKLGAPTSEKKEQHNTFIINENGELKTSGI
jgi:hypothetical protein